MSATPRKWQQAIFHNHELSVRAAKAMGRYEEKVEILARDVANHAITAALMAALSPGTEKLASHLAWLAAEKCRAIGRRCSDPAERLRVFSMANRMSALSDRMTELWMAELGHGKRGMARP